MNLKNLFVGALAAAGIVCGHGAKADVLSEKEPINGGWFRTVTTEDGVYSVVAYTNTAKSGFSFSLPEGVTAIDYLVVAGGGGGGGGAISGGGGAGGMLTNAVPQAVTSGEAMTVVVGAGGNGGPVTRSGYNGGDSTLSGGGLVDTITAYGGGGGANYNGPKEGATRYPLPGNKLAGYAGGSGGGAPGGMNTTADYVGGSATNGQGNAGGKPKIGASVRSGAGGGGGAGAAGGDGAGGYACGKGGDGLPCSITGEEVWYAGGGGGGGNSNYADGGQGGGGKGYGQAGTDGLGGGGGGVYNNAKIAGGKGGDGIVIIRYLGGAKPCPPPAEQFVTLSVTCGETETYKAFTNDSVEVTGPTVVSNAMITLVATPASGYRYATIPEGWTAGTAAGTIVRKVKAAVDPTEVAIPAATAIPQYTLTIEPTTNGSIAGQAGTYYEGTTVKLTAKPATDYLFVEWTGDKSGAENPLTLTITGNLTVGATFAPKPRYTLTTAVEPSECGTITGGGAADYVEGSSVKLTAVPAAGYRFVEWTGDASGSDATITITMTANKSVTAHFAEKDKLALTLTECENGSIHGATSGDLFTEGAVFALRAVPAKGYTFVGWTGDATSTDNPLVVTMDAAKTIGATFEAIPTDVPTGARVTLPREDGWVKTFGLDTIVAFTNVNKTHSFTIPEGVTAIDYLVVAGGGGGAGPYNGGGGGAGGLLTNATPVVVASGEGLSITVGKGGAGGDANAAGSDGGLSSITSTWETAVFLGVEAKGGGGGGNKAVKFNESLGAGRDGGSGGGGGGANKYGSAGGNGTVGQGNAGAASSANGQGIGGGGGGAGAAATDKNGGAGLTCSISGENLSYAAGGGGGANGSNAGGKGGSGIGGDGGVNKGSYNGLPGADGTGSGGGGSVGWGVSGGKGGDGVVIIRFRYVSTDPVVLHKLTINQTKLGKVNGVVTGCYDEGDVFNLTAQPDKDCRFLGWTDDVADFGKQNPIQVTLTNDLTVSASFELDLFNLTIVPPENGTISGGTSGAYVNGTKMTLTATPAEGYFFAGWTVDGVFAGKDASLAVTVNADKTVSARFDPLVYTGNVRITEFSAKNSSVVSACGKKECDWIELTNFEPNTIQLAGWGLTSKKKDHYLVKIPEGVAIAGGETMLIFCGDTTEVCAKGELHVALSLSKDAGKFIGLYDANDQAMTEITYPAQMNDISYGYGYLDPTDPAAELKELYFKDITPGAANTNRGYTVKTPTVVISEPHGYKTEPFDLTISCPDNPDAAIYYTTNGKAPTTADKLYTGPVHISKTTCIRAGVPDPDAVFQHDTSATYLYLDDILQQPCYRDAKTYDGHYWNDPVYAIYHNLGFPQSHRLDLRAQDLHYGFDTNVLNQGDMRQRVLEGMTNGIDTISLVIDSENLFNGTTGIYVNAYRDGRDWERQTMVECICPTNSANDFSISAGLRIRGGTSRQVVYPKHSLRLYFRNEYGVDALEKPIFGDERGAVSKFSKMDLRTSQNWSVAGCASAHDTFVHETFLRDVQGKLGQPYTRSRYYHLYINGIYWGLYETQERADEDYAESYLGGDADDYDIIKRSFAYADNGNVRGTEWNITGNLTAYNQLCSLSAEGFAGDKSGNYLKAMGLNPDGTRNLAYPILLDDDNLMTYMLINHYTCNSDSPVGYGVGMNNLYAIRNRVDDETGKGHNGFVFLCHDGEHSFGTETTFDDKAKENSTIRQVQCNYTNDYTFNSTSAKDVFRMIKPDADYSRYAKPAVPGSTSTGFFGPSELNYKLMMNDEYRMKFADFVYRTCLKEGGVLTIPEAKKIFANRMAQLDNAIAAEYSRWNWKGNEYPLPTYDTWTNACAECFAFIDKRLDYLIPQYRSHGWYPLVDAPTAAEEAGNITLFTTNETATVYYTTDGSDPRLAGGAVSESAVAYTAAIPVGADDIKLRARLLSASGEWSALETLDVKGSAANPQQALRLCEIYGSTRLGDGDLGEFVVLTNLSDKAVSLKGFNLVSQKSGKAPSLNITLTEGEIAPYGTNRLEQATLWPSAKITNGSIVMTITDSDGAVIQVANAAFSGDADGGGASLLANNFENPCNDWRVGPIHDKPEPPTPPPGPQPGGDVIAGDYPNGTNIVLAAATTLKLGNATFGGPLVITGAAATLELQAGTTATIPVIDAKGIALTIDGTGTLAMSNDVQMITCGALTVTNGTVSLLYTGTVAESKAVELTGSYVQYGGTVTVDLRSTAEVYGIFMDKKSIDVQIYGGEFNTTVEGGAKSATFKLCKGSNNVKLSGGTLNATLKGDAPRFIQTKAKIDFKGATVTLAGDATNARVFKSVETQTVSGGVVKGEITGAGSEIFSSDDDIKVKGGVIRVTASDDCFSAATNIVISAGKVQAVSTLGDAIDSNGSMTISGGEVFAFACSLDGEGLDVDPKDAADGQEHKLVITDAAVVVSVGGVTPVHGPDAGSTTNYVTATGLAQAKKYVSFASVTIEEETNKVTRTYAVNWNKKHPETYTLLIAAPGFDKTYSQVKNPTDDDPLYVELDANLDNIYVKTVVEPIQQKVVVDPSKTGGVIPVSDPKDIQIVTTWSNGTVEVKLDLTAAYVFEPTTGGYLAKLNKDAVVTVGTEEIAVQPTLVGVEDEEIKPFTMEGDNTTVGVKTIPGLLYSLLRGTDVQTIDVSIIETRATGPRTELTDENRPSAKAFYRVQVK